MTSILNADLHCHSVVSDGTLTPEALAARAAANGVELWALTDHDEVGGQAQAAAAARANAAAAAAAHATAGELRHLGLTAAHAPSAVVKDLRGVACPMNFVKTKMELSQLKSKEILEIWLDSGEPIENVPGSVREEGHTILEQKKIGDYWSVIIEKK